MIKNKLIFLIKRIISIIVFPFYSEYPQVFLYHEVSNNPSQLAIDNGLYVNNKTFENQVKWIIKRYRVIDPIDILSDKIDEFSKKPYAIISFDDGNSSIFENAAPILRKYGLKALLFLNMESIEGATFIGGLVAHQLSKNKLFKKRIFKNNKGKKDPYLRVNKEQIDTLLLKMKENKNFSNNVNLYMGEFGNSSQVNENHDVFVYGSHLYNHYNAVMLTKNELKEQLQKNANSLLKNNGNPLFFSYPYGQSESCYNNDIDSFIKNQNIEKIFYASGKLNKSLRNTFIDRMSMDNVFNIGFMKYKVAGVYFLNTISRNKNFYRLISLIRNFSG